MSHPVRVPMLERREHSPEHPCRSGALFAPLYSKHSHPLVNPVHCLWQFSWAAKYRCGFARHRTPIDSQSSLSRVEPTKTYGGCFRQRGRTPICLPSSFLYLVADTHLDEFPQPACLDSYGSTTLTNCRQSPNDSRRHPVA